MTRPRSGGTSNFLTPVPRTTLTADVCRKLMAHLIRGDWLEGDRIPSERELCRRLAVGRASLREALKALEIIGMIESRVGDGTFVCRRSEFLSRPLIWAITGSTQSDLHEIIEARLTMEAALAGFAAERGTVEDLNEIGKYLDDMAAAGDNMGSFLEADLSFHLAIAQAARNQILLNAVQLIRNLMRQWSEEALGVEGTAALVLEQHKAVFLAIAKRDKEGARAAMSAHLDATGKLLTELKQVKRSTVEVPSPEPAPNLESSEPVAPASRRCH